MRVLVLNPGSSSLKSSVIETASIPVAGATGLIPAVSAESLAPVGQLGVDWGVDGLSPAVLRIVAREDLVVARETARVVRGGDV